MKSEQDTKIKITALTEKNIKRSSSQVIAQASKKRSCGQRAR